jgi:hypothetical protein
MATFWVSFADEDEFLGAAIVDADCDTYDVETIIREIIDLGCNPPGECRAQIQRIPGFPERFKNRLLTKDDIDLLIAGGRTN